MHKLAAIGLLATTSLCSLAAHAAEVTTRTTTIDTVVGSVELPLVELSEADKIRLSTPAPRFAGLEPAAGGEIGMWSIRSVMTPVRNQNPRGSCNVFAAIAVFEATDWEDYSEQCLAKLSSNRDPGWPEARMTWAFANGLYREANCPYDPSNRDNIPNLVGVPVVQQLGSIDQVSPNGDNIEGFVRGKLSEFLPVVTSMLVIGNEWSGNDAIINLPSEAEIQSCINQAGGCPAHSIVFTGHDSDLGYYEFKNSWGTGWGRGGYGWMSDDYYRRLHVGDMSSIK